MAVVIETTIGDVTIDLFHEERPRTCMNFLKLCKMKYYNLNLIYSIEQNFLAQMGDPTGTGRGGSSIFSNIYGEQARYYEGEKIPVMKHTKIGTVSMVSCNKDHLFGSQFFITLGENLDSLDGEHLIFGEVVEGYETIEKLNKALTDDDHRPYQDIRITHTIVLHDPFPDPKQLEVPSRSPSPTEAMLKSNYIAVDEDVDENEGKSMEELNEYSAGKEANTRATILEMLGDLPDADVRPDENVIFVCKLNPVTTSEDLEIIFSRFGKIKSCEIIYDKMTKNSLQYGFIQYAEKKACEDAYFKMDNVLIDDRRIHVDFNQSVARLRWKGKGNIEYFDDKGRKTKDPTVFNPNKLFTNSNSRNKRKESPSNGSLQRDKRDRREKEKKDEAFNRRNKDYSRDEERNSNERRNGRNKDNERRDHEFRDCRRDKSYYRDEERENRSHYSKSRRDDRSRDVREEDYKSKDGRSQRHRKEMNENHRYESSRDDYYKKRHLSPENRSFRDARNESYKARENIKEERFREKAGRSDDYRRIKDHDDRKFDKHKKYEGVPSEKEISKQRKDGKEEKIKKKYDSDSSSSSTSSGSSSSDDSEEDMDEKTAKMMKLLQKEIKREEKEKKKKKHSKKKKTKKKKKKYTDSDSSSSN